MAIPDYQSCMLPLLRLLSDGETHVFRDCVESLGDHFQLTEEERKELLPSGQYPILSSRVGWARTYLKKAGLLESPKRGLLVISRRGREFLSKKPDKITSKDLEQFEEFVEFKNYKKDDIPKAIKEEEPDAHTPEEAIETAYKGIKNNLSNEILELIKNGSPSLFENIVVDLLLKMGYGGSRKDAGSTVGKSGDEGIDGIIKEDKLGLDVIYLQAKRWEGAVGRPEIQKFAGALMGKKAKKGVFITTSTFSKNAIEYADNLENKIVLIDGEKLTELMIDHDLGVSLSAKYEIKKVDTDFFMEG
jgi:restriction system protein